MITIFTPTYNRKFLLLRLYQSLILQTQKNFEWLIVDDGSSDGTDILVNDKIISKENSFPIHYFKKENGGKHSAINFGVEKAEGELFFIVDSDDILPHNSIEVVYKEWEKVKSNQEIAGVCGLDATLDGRVIGSGLPQQVIDASALEVRFRMGVTGDMKEIFRTSILRQYPFPVIEGEHFCPEMLVWNRIAAKYKLHFFNIVIYIADYQIGGVTDSIVLARMKSPIATVRTYFEMMSYPIPLKWKIKSIINYWRFRLCLPINYKSKNPSWYWFIFFPLGVLLHLIDLRKSSK